MMTDYAFLNKVFKIDLTQLCLNATGSTQSFISLEALGNVGPVHTVPDHL